MQFERPGLARQRIADELRHRIISGELSPGERVRQEQIAAEFGTSQGPVREAFRTLAGEGFLTRENHRGYRVVTVSSIDAEQIRDVRDLLESHALRLAVSRLGPPERESIEQRHREMSLAEVDDGVAFDQAHEAFHLEIFSYANSPRLVAMLRTQWQHAQRIRSVALRDTTRKAANLSDGHDQLLAACLAGDVEAAVRAMRDHRDGAFRATIQAVTSN